MAASVLVGGTLVAEEAPWQWELPPGFPRPSVPEDNPMSAAKVALGRQLFYDTRLSVDGSQACATCHQQAHAFTDGRKRPVGVTGVEHPRGAMSLTNVAYGATFGWADPGLRSLEAQARVPLFNRHPVEMGWRRPAELAARLSADPETRRRFAAVFDDPKGRTRRRDRPVTVRRVVQAIAAFERTLISGRSAYDRLVFLDDRAALSASARRGMKLFFSERLACGRCHAGFNVSGPIVLPAGREEPKFHNTGLYNLIDARGRPGAYPPDAPGLAEHTGRRRDTGRFRAPTLRNIALTAPYMHDGSLATLEAVVEHYRAGGRTVLAGPWRGVGRASPLKSPLVRGFDLDARGRRDLVAFLHSLTDHAFVSDPALANPFPQVPPPDAP